MRPTASGALTESPPPSAATSAVDLARAPALSPAKDGSHPTRRLRGGRPIVRRRLFALLALVVPALMAGAATNSITARPEPASLHYFPPQTVVAVVYPLGDVEQMLEAMSRLLPFVADEKQKAAFQAIGSWEQRHGIRLRDELGGAFCCEVGFGLSLESIDPFFDAGGSNEDASRVFSGSVLFAGIKDRARFDGLVQKVVAAAHGSVSVAGPVSEVTFPHEDGDISLFYRYHDDRVLLGMSREAIDAAVARREGGTGLPTSALFKEASASLRPNVRSLFYVNLPQVKRLLDASKHLRALTEQDPGLAQTLQLFVPNDGWTRALLQSSHEVPGGTLYEHYVGDDAGLFLHSQQVGGTLKRTLMARLAPSGRVAPPPSTDQLRAMYDMRFIATRLEAYRSAHSEWPQAFGLVPITSVAQAVPSEDGRPLPATDPWGSPYFVRFHGSDFLLVSFGAEQTYDSRFLGGPARSPRGTENLDLVLASGKDFLQWPGSGMADPWPAGLEAASSEELPLAAAVQAGMTTAGRDDDTLSVQGGVTPPQLVRRVEPEYPENARRSGVEGKVILQAVVEEDGTIGSLKLLRAPSLDIGLSDAARRAVSAWKYEPATEYGKPVRVYLTVVVTFKLE